MSYNNLAINNANFNLEGKLATLWFDNLLLGTGKELVEKVMEDVAEKEQWSSDTFKEWEQISNHIEMLQFQCKEHRQVMLKNLWVIFGNILVKRIGLL